MTKTQEGLEVLQEALYEVQTTIDHYFLHQYTGTTIQDLIVQVNEMVEEVQ